METIPKVDEVSHVRIALDVESWMQKNWNKVYARNAMIDVLQPFTRILDQEEYERFVDEGDELEPSEYDSEVMCFAASVHMDLTVYEWIELADLWSIELEDDEVLPRNAEPTLGILDAEGVVPAVSIPNMSEGYGSGGFEPALFVTLYVAVAVAEGVVLAGQEA